MIEPPDYLLQFPAALPAWHRITGHLERIDSWEPIYQSGCAVAAMQSAQYIACCRIHGVREPVTVECGAVARAWLVDLLYLDRVTPVPIDDLGRDLDLVRLVLDSAA